MKQGIGGGAVASQRNFIGDDQVHAVRNGAQQCFSCVATGKINKHRTRERVGSNVLNGLSWRA